MQEPASWGGSGFFGGGCLVLGERVSGFFWRVYLVLGVCVWSWGYLVPGGVPGLGGWYPNMH